MYYIGKKTIPISKAVIFMIISVFCSINVSAQTVIKITKLDGSETEIYLAEIDVITFANKPLSIGDNFAGGIVFYIDGSGEHGLISASTDQSSGAAWGCDGTPISGADGTALGTGNQNTIDIEAGCATAGIAADLCANLTLNGYTDWYLPSKDELILMYNNLHYNGLGSFTSNYYWSSSEIDFMNAWSIKFTPVILESNEMKSYNYRVRAIRAF